MSPLRQKSIFRLWGLCGSRWLRWLLISYCVCSLAAAKLAITKDDVILCYGSSMVDRMLEHGELEAYLQLAHPGKNVKVRSLNCSTRLKR